MFRHSSGMKYRTERIIVTLSLLGINTLVYLSRWPVFVSHARRLKVWIMNIYGLVAGKVYLGSI